jgi:hypothetical protein
MAPSVRYREVMRKSLGSCLVLLAACHMYGPSEPLKNPRKIDPKDRPPEPVVTVTYVEDCNYDFDAKPRKPVVRETSAADKAILDGDNVFDTAETAKAEEVRIERLKASVARYSEALRKDPFNAHATRKLALAYDKVLRKGCAIALLKRLERLSQNPKFADDATEEIDRISDHDRWFKDYRKDALAAIGRRTP